MKALDDAANGGELVERILLKLDVQGLRTKGSMRSTSHITAGDGYPIGAEFNA
jgi:hypothetical protein